MRGLATLSALALSAAITLSSVSAQGCKNSPMGGNCPLSAPCCSSAGYCGSDPSFCAEACIASGSFAADSCWPLPMAKVLYDDFTNKSKLVNTKDFSGFPDSADWVIDRSAGTLPHAEITDENKLLLRLNRLEKHPTTGGGIGATVHSSRWLHYGTIEARLKTASDVNGPVSSFILISPLSGDEIDFEIVGKDPTDVQTNFYYRVAPGRPVNYQNGVHIIVSNDTSKAYHDYKVEWTPTEMKWYFDGELKRTALASSANGEYPDTPMRVAFGLWDGGYGDPGTADWAGANTDYGPTNNREYQLTVDWVRITPMNPDNSTEPWPGAKYLKQMEDGNNDNKGADGGTGNGGDNGKGPGNGHGGNGGNGGDRPWRSDAASAFSGAAGTLVVAMATVIAAFMA